MEETNNVKTTEERTITLNLSDIDCTRIALKAGLTGKTVSELIEEMIYDLIGEFEDMPSPNSDAANIWYEYYHNNDSLLSYILIDGLYSLQKFIKTANSLEDDKKNFPDSYDDIVVKNYIKNYKYVNLDYEISKCEAWLKEHNNNFKKPK